MKTRTRWILAALTVLLLPLAISVPLSKAQVSRISRGALLLRKNVLSLPGRILGSAMLGSSAKLAAAEPNKDDDVITGSSYRNDVSPPLRDLPPSPVSAGKGEREANANPKIPSHHVDGADTVVQRQHVSTPTIPGTILNFDGIPYPGVVCNCAPPDTDGEVGSTQYVQIVNEGFQVFDKVTGASVLGPVALSTLWAGFGGVCQTAGSGDPVVLYDQLANRWIISQFALTGGAATDECIAVSTTSDAAGAYFRYGFHLGANFFDYPKLAVWPDAYYMSMNVFNTAGTAFLGPQPFAFDRAALLAGNPATFVSTGITVGPTEDPYLPADLDGSRLPPAGSPATFVEWPGSGVYKVYHMHADFAVPANTTFTLFASPAAAPFTELCPTTRACVPQLGSTSNLDGIGDRLMFRAADRFFPDGHEALVSNFSVLSGGVSGIRWFELRNVTAGPVTVFQESTYQPDTTWRWMGSAAMDNQANLALGFSASDATIFPQIRYAGRLATDPLNTLAQGEAHLFDGTGSQTGTSNRWGDYSDMTIDPVDDCTFWYTQEYYATTGSFNWRTRIGNFKFAECTPPATGTAHFVVTICDGGSPLANALVSIDGSLYGATAANGTLDATLAAGTHSFSISKATFTTVTGTFDITDGETTNVPVCLVGTPIIVPAGSTLVAEGCLPHNGAIDPNETVTVSFALMNTGGASTTNLVATLQNSGGVTPMSGPQTYGAIPPGGTAARDFSFLASGACGGTITATLQLQDGATNLGTATFTFRLGVLTVALTENFDGVTPPALPAGWVATNATGPAPLWVTSNSGTPAPPADTAPNAAFVDDPSVVSDKRLDSPSIAIASGSAQVTFRNNYALESGFDGGVLEISIGGGAFADIVTAGGSFVTGGYNGTISTSFSNPLAGRQAWTGSSGGFITTTANLPAAAAGNNIQLRWRMGSDTSVSSLGWRVDTVSVTDGFVCCGPQIVAAGANLVSESCPPPNGAIDPGETVTVSFCVRNTGLTDTVDLVGTLLATGGVTNPSGPQDYGVVVAGGPAVCRDFTFTAEGTCGGTITATLQLQDGPNNLGTVTYTFTLGTTTPTTASFSNTTPIIIPGTGTSGPASPYPSNIAVTGMSGLTTKVTVSLNNMNHTFPGDVDVLLVGPGGQKFIILSDVIGGTDWVGINYTLDDAAASLVPSSGTPVSGTFKPTNYGTGDTFVAPAPPGPYQSPATAGSATFASVFNGSDPNGTWSLFVVDDASGDVGNFNGGWSITITTAAPVCTTPCPPPTNTPTDTPTPTNTPTPTSTPTPTRTPTPTLTPTPSCVSPCVIPPPPAPIVVTDCTAPPVTTSSNWTQINLPGSDVVLHCALNQLPGTTGVRILAHSILVDGPAGGSVNSTGTNGTQLIAGSGAGQCNAGATVDVESASVVAGNPNGGLKISACGDIVLNNSAVNATTGNMTVTSSGGRVCATGDTMTGSVVFVTANGDLTMHGTSVTVATPSDTIKLTSTAGSVLAGGGVCLPNRFTGGNGSSMSVTASGVIDLSSACVEIAQDITVTASGSGFVCATDVIINVANAEIRNDFGQKGTITMTACGGAGKIDIGNAILVDNGKKGGGNDPDKVSNLNGSLATQPVNCAASTVPTCTARPLDAANNPVSADPADRAAHNVVGVPRCDT